MKPLNIKRRASLKTDMAMKEEALSILEGMRQEELAGVYDPALAERNNRLIMGTIDDSPVAPYNTVMGNEVQGRGIAGPFQPDSNVRMHTEYGNTGDALLDADAAQYGLRELGINTEYLSPEGAQDLYKRWAAEVQPTQRRGDKRQDTVNNFNRFLGEYYGQQALKLAGARPVADRDRSYNVRMDNGRNPNSTLGTDRLIETNASLLGGDVGRPAGDYRYAFPDGTIGVGDYQVSTFTNNPLEAEVRLQMMKGSAMPKEMRRGFVDNLRQEAQGAKSIDEALFKMKQRGLLPELSQGEIKQNRARPGDSGMRAGKMLSDAWFMGAANMNDRNGNPGQHRYQHVLFGINDAAKQESMPGVVPSAFYDVNAEAARRYMAENAGTADIRINDNPLNGDGSTYYLEKARDLLNAGVATNLAEAYPTINQLLQPQR